MADENTTNKNSKAESDKLETYAFRLFTDRTARSMGRAAEQVAIACYRDAETFLSIAQRVRSGELVASDKEERQLSDASAPKLPQTHPVNLVSQAFAEKNGGVPAVKNRIKSLVDYLNQNPTLGTNPEDTIQEIDGFKLNWGKAEIGTARAILPAYAIN